LLGFSLIVPALAEDFNLKMGNPSAATASASNRNNFLMEKPYFAISFNDRLGTPNWVSWRLTATDIGRSPRFPFLPDDSLPSDFKHVLPEDYSGDGFDRGHMCNHADRSANDDMSKSTFVMTNMIPQASNCNQKGWNSLEMYCRDVAKQGKTLYIISGPYGTGGTSKDGYRTIIGKNTQINVPAKCWKVIMVLDSGPGDDIQKVNSKTRLIGVVMPNDMSVGAVWDGYRVSVASVEKLTGYKFFDKVPASVITPLKNKVDAATIPPPVIYSEVPQAN
jgi:endonuclease G, mitochondrial